MAYNSKLGIIGKYQLSSQRYFFLSFYLLVPPIFHISSPTKLCFFTLKHILQEKFSGHFGELEVITTLSYAIYT